MKSNIVMKIFAVILIASAIYVFDYSSFNKICVSLILTLNGINAFIYDSASNDTRAISKWCSRAMYLVIFILIAKLLFWGF